MSINLLAEPIRKVIRKNNWPSLRPIQAAAIMKIMTSNDNFILASKTASGKTEAAFLPILSKTNFNEAGVQVLYISPLISLINDQFLRIEDLCKELEISVTKWHGEAKKSLKTKLIQNPKGIVLITPESIEAMFVHSPYLATTLFNNLKFVVIDEIHSFIGTDRGIQLASLLSRIQALNPKRFSVIALSATIGADNFQEAKKITNNSQLTKVLLDTSKNDTLIRFKYLESPTSELSLELLKDLYINTKDSKVLIFPNSRARTEEIAVKLKKISTKLKGHNNYFSHHSSVDKEIREAIEQFAKDNIRYNFCIACTSTLELGIDIGTVDKIVQIDSTFSVSSLVQRVGRSGRKDGTKSQIDLYATEKWSLLQSLACWNLYEKDELEAISFPAKPYDIALHQILSFVKQSSGCTINGVIKSIKNTEVLALITEEELREIISDAVTTDLLEMIRNELIIGIEGEKIVNSREFFSVFKSEYNLKVLNSGRTIGEIPYSPQIQLDQNIFLSAKVWKIIDIDFKSKKIHVIKANDGKSPLFFGSSGVISPIIRVEMLKILKNEISYFAQDDDCYGVIKDLMSDFVNFTIKDYEHDRPIILTPDKLKFYTFNGTKFNRTFSFILKMLDISFNLYDQKSSFELDMNLIKFKEVLKKIEKSSNQIDFWLSRELQENESLISFSKWASFLSPKHQIEIIKERYFDFEKTFEFLKSINLVTANKLI